MPLVKLEGDYTGREASSFVSDLATMLVKAVDLSGILADVQVATGLDEDDLREILTSHFEAFAEREDEEILDWVIARLVD